MMLYLPAGLLTETHLGTQYVNQMKINIDETASSNIFKLCIGLIITWPQQ